MHQQHTYQPFPNFAHPPPTIEHSLPTIDDSTIDQFLIDRNHLNIQANEEKIFNRFKPNGRDRLNVIQMNIQNLIKQQRLDETNLKINVAQLSPSIWTEKINLLKQNQTKIAELLTKFETLTSEQTEATIVQRKQKNKRKRKSVHHLTDQPANKREDIEEATKRPKAAGDLEESYEKYEIERLRSANLKRISDCKKQLTLLNSLIELRCIRRKNANASGSGQVSNENRFIEQIDKLKCEWMDALQKCTAHDNELKMLLTNTTSQLWLNALFSNTEPAFTDDTMDFRKLMDIRKSWDLCLVTDDNVFGSSIPPGWVLPNGTPSEEWASFLVK